MKIEPTKDVCYYCGKEIYKGVHDGSRNWYHKQDAGVFCSIGSLNKAKPLTEEDIKVIKQNQFNDEETAIAEFKSELEEEIIGFSGWLEESFENDEIERFWQAARNLFAKGVEKGHQEGWDDACCEFDVDDGSVIRKRLRK